MWMLVVTFLIFVAYFIYLDIRKPHKFPNGPKWYPLLGNFTQFSQKLKEHGYHHKVWEEFAKEYGDLIGLKMGNIYVVSVNGPDMVREVLARDEFSGRPDGFFFKLRTFGKQIGVVFSEGEFWEKQRRFTVLHLKNFGFGKHQMETILQEEVHELITLLKEQCVKGPIEMKHAFDVSVLNTLWTMAAGKRYELKDERLIYLVGLVHKAFTAVDASGGLVNQMPFLRFIAPNLTGYTLVKEVIDSIQNFIRETIKEHLDTYDEDAPKDLIDVFIKKMHNNDETFTEEQLISLCMDLFMAGSETTSNTLAFAVIYLAKYPDVQRKMQQEINEILGSRTPTLRDKIMLPYTNAVLCEIQRITNVGPVGVPHKAICDTILSNYVIPKGTIILTNIYSIHMDVNFWGDPENFRPERFLNEQGCLEIPEKYFLPFGFGKRRCLGESLAKANYFLAITALLQNFIIEKNPESDLNLSVRDGFTLAPYSAKLVLKMR